MESTGTGRAGGPFGPDVLGVAASLRWSRPDLTAGLAEFWMESASAEADRNAWLVAAGWRLHAAAATGDGRDVASDVLEAAARWGADVLRAPAAGRLRIELAVLAQDSGDAPASRALLHGLPVDGTDAELVADLREAEARCLLADDVDASDAAALDAATAPALAAWAAVGGVRGDLGSAGVQAAGAAAARRGGQPDTAVAMAVDGLNTIDRARGSADALTPSGYLTAGLAVEWIAALIEAGRPDHARDGSAPLQERLVEYARPTRQLALLRLTIARAAASEPGRPQPRAIRDLEQAARDAAASDVPALEHVCCTALGELYEAAGRPAEAVESIRRAVEADRRHRRREERFRAALARTEPLWRAETPHIRSTAAAPGAGSPAETPAGDAAWTMPQPGRPVASAGTGADRPRSPNANGSAVDVDRTAVLRAVQTVAMADRAEPEPSRSYRTSPVDPWATGDWTVNHAATPENGAAADGTSAPPGVVPAAPADEPGPVDESRAGAVPPAPHADSADPGGAGTAVADATAGGAPPETAGEHADGATADPGTEPKPPAVDDRTTARTADGGGDPGAALSTSDVSAPASTAGDSPGVPTAHFHGTRTPGAKPDPPTSLDPDTWLADALADLDRIWKVGDDPRAERDDSAVAVAAGDCVIVLDLAMAGERLAAEAAAPTVRRLVRRLEDRLPPASRLRDDGPDTVSVIMSGRDRASAAEWLQQVLPGLVDGLAVDAAAGGALLRAAVHDADGTAGGQILQQLDGARGRNGSRTRESWPSPRPAAAGVARPGNNPDEIGPSTTLSAAAEPDVARDPDGRAGASSGARPGGPARARSADGGSAGPGMARDLPGGAGASTGVRPGTPATVRPSSAAGNDAEPDVARDPDGTAGTSSGVRPGTPAVARSASAAGDGVGPGAARDLAGGAGASTGGRPGTPATVRPSSAAGGDAEPDVAGDPEGRAGASGGARPGSPAVAPSADGDAGHEALPGSGMTGAAGIDADPVGGAAVAGAPVRGGEVGQVPGGTPDDAVPDASSRPAAPRRTVARHDQSGERRPYLPAGVVVRPGSGGRRHRRAAEPVHLPPGDGGVAPARGAGVDQPAGRDRDGKREVADGAPTGPTGPEPRREPTHESDAAPRAEGPGAEPAPTRETATDSRAERPDELDMPSPDGLGLADLLAGALAAYRRI